MISDALRFKGLPAGTRMLFGGNLVELYEDGSAHLVDSGTLAGSTLRINEGVYIKSCAPDRHGAHEGLSSSRKGRRHSRPKG